MPEDSVRGYDVKAKDGGIVPTQLFGVHASESGKGDIKAYCVELDVDIKFGIDLKVTGWGGFPGAAPSGRASAPRF